MIYRRYGKRCLDLAIATCMLVITSPILFLTAVAIRLEDGRPVLYRHQRVGRDGVAFECLKFRSMPLGTSALPSADSASLDLTRVGHLIRRTNIDELPQLVNVVRREMSIVGPRPPLRSQSSLVELRRMSGALACQPGLTGLAQVSSYDSMPESEKAALDAEYAERVSLATDLSILLRTIPYMAKPPPRY